ncbi:MAG: hypothetical protein WKG00_15360 [Polyangiaceae bacterium]
MKKSRMTAVMVLLSGAAILLSSSVLAIEVASANGIDIPYGVARALRGGDGCELVTRAGANERTRSILTRAGWPEPVASHLPTPAAENR